MKAVGDLDGGVGTLPGTVGIGFLPITRDHLILRTLPEPPRQGLGRAIGEECDRLAALEIDEYCAEGVAFPHRKIVHAEHSGTGQRRDRQPAEHAQEGATAHGPAQAPAELCACRLAQCQGDMRQPVQETLRPPGPGGHHTGGSRSVKMERGQRPLAQKNFRTPSCNTTRQWAHGRSAMVRR